MSNTVRVAIIGVGNCASSFVQGVEYYKKAKAGEQVPGLMHVNLGGYHISDIEFVAAIDIDANKVGKDLSEAIYAPPNNTVQVLQGAEDRRQGRPRHDARRHRQVHGEDHQEGAGPDRRHRRHPQEDQDRRRRQLPAGRQRGGHQVVHRADSQRPAAPWSTASPSSSPAKPYWQARFKEKGLPIIGDDIKSQVGATIVHRTLASLMLDRGVRLERTSQLNVGGNSDFMNMLERERLESKKISKTNAVTSLLDYDIGADNVHIGPSDHVAWLEDRKWAYIRLEGRTFGDVPLNIELKLEVVDSPNSAGIVIDAVRCAKLALDRGIAGTLEGPGLLFHEITADPASGRYLPQHDRCFHRRNIRCRGSRLSGSHAAGSKKAAPKKADRAAKKAVAAKNHPPPARPRPKNLRAGRQQPGRRPLSGPGPKKPLKQQLSSFSKIRAAFGGPFSFHLLSINL